MDNYIKDIIEIGKVYGMNDYRTIITDRMGSWSNQDLILAWEGDGKDRAHICVSPDEAEILFEKGLIKNVERDYKDKLYIQTVFCDIRTFDGAIVCGMLAPSINLRKGIFDYAKKKGYILDNSTPVQMFNGVKSLTCNADRTYKITYKWSDEIIEKFNMEMVKQFTRKFFEKELNNTMYHYTDKKFYSSPMLIITEEDFSVDNLLEKEVFDRTSIDAFREYDIQIKLLSPTIDRVNLLKALVYIGFTCDPCPENIYMRYEESIRTTNLFLNLPLTPYIPVLSQKRKSVKLHSGTIVYVPALGYESEYYYYKIDVPYSEGVRSLMKTFKTLMAEKYERKFFYISFEPYKENVGFMVFNEAIGHFRGQIEDEFVILDYAITIQENIKNLNYHQMIRTMLEFFESDSNLPYKETFDYYYDWLYKILKKEN